MAVDSPLLTPRRAPARVVLRPLAADDVAEVQSMLAGLPRDYPGGDRWLARRLVDVLQGRATCELATLNERIVGATIGTPKARATKLSTIFVDPNVRRAQIGSQLLDAFISRAPAGGEIYVTVAHYRWPELGGLLESRGFTATVVEPDRYGPGRDEIVATLVAC